VGEYVIGTGNGIYDASVNYSRGLLEHNPGYLHHTSEDHAICTKQQGIFGEIGTNLIPVPFSNVAEILETTMIIHTVWFKGIYFCKPQDILLVVISSGTAQICLSF
jgi:2-hydroxy-3-keto-5-methylthiopentenyl-1-phosphate phosphatase